MIPPESAARQRRRRKRCDKGTRRIQLQRGHLETGQEIETPRIGRQQEKERGTGVEVFDLCGEVQIVVRIL
jgi:hypothetical protein